jgi:hypothetical protein
MRAVRAIRHSATPARFLTTSLTVSRHHPGVYRNTGARFSGPLPPKLSRSWANLWFGLEAFCVCPRLDSAHRQSTGGRRVAHVHTFQAIDLVTACPGRTRAPPDLRPIQGRSARLTGGHLLISVVGAGAAGRGAKLGARSQGLVNSFEQLLEPFAGRGCESDVARVGPGFDFGQCFVAPADEQVEELPVQ